MIGVVWHRIDAALDSDPRVRAAGFWGTTAFLAILRQAKLRGRGGRVDAAVADGAYLAELLRADRAVDDAPRLLAEGVEAAIRAGLLERDGADLVIIGWAGFQIDPTNAKRQGEYRKRQDEAPEAPIDQPDSPSNGAERYTPEVTATGGEGRGLDVTGKDRTGEEERSDAGASQSPPSDVEVVFSYWQQVMEHPRAKLDAKRRRTIERAIRDHGVEKIKAAINGCKATPWNMGANPSGKRYDSIGLILKDADQVERFADPGKPTSQVRTGRKVNAAWQEAPTP